MIDHRLDVTQYIPQEKDFERLGSKLTAFTLAKGGPDYNPKSVAFKINAKDIACSRTLTLGELIATTLWGRLEVNLLEVSEPYRRQGVGTALLNAAEDFARAGGLVGVHLWTPTWQGEGFYNSRGYKEVARLNLGTQGHFKNNPTFNILYSKDFTP